ncbi:nicotinamide riboside transporter PnuC [Teredinibacter purpureus]|uniref:nicotinamide riboside transporter PnuC n=1 Tax=Teredinibacter purpureus TaxID=2731756 RepID=UPI0005F81287|nr:nicotinamide riboside transporter PnuC [Teredinibacter purpureus]
MLELFQQGFSGLMQQSGWELIAVALAIAYLVLVIRESRWCWPCAFFSTAIFSWVFFDVSLVMESLLNVYYMVMAVYGYWCWQKHNGAAKEKQANLSISFLSFSQHLYAITLIAVLTLVSGYFLSEHTQAAWPYLDSFTTWGAVVTTYMVARKIFENWLYWLVIDSVALYLYWDRELYATALLMMLYLVLVVVGIYTWSRQIRRPPIDESALA